ncbi:MAG TPA: CHAP domain-containing protein [Lachnospiraceae bacterium]|nr:CHAP domain-containing protein [Lachnospiraceae bacterium]
MNRKLAEAARLEAISCFHGNVMGTKANLEPIISSFPIRDMRKWDNRWCAAFVYYCCIKAGIELPIKHPDQAVSCNFSGCIAWKQWAQLPDYDFWHEGDEIDFVPEPGDIIMFDYVLEGMILDHMGIILENNDHVILVAEGNFNNVSAIVQRNKDKHIRGFIRLFD